MLVDVCGLFKRTHRYMYCIESIHFSIDLLVIDHENLFVYLQISFVGIRGSSYTGDIAIDEVVLTRGKCGMFLLLTSPPLIGHSNQRPLLLQATPPIGISSYRPLTPMATPNDHSSYRPLLLQASPPIGFSSYRPLLMTTFPIGNSSYRPLLLYRHSYQRPLLLKATPTKGHSY